VNVGLAPVPANAETFNRLLGIDNAGVSAGYFGSGAAGQPNQGDTVAPPYAAFAADNVPGSVQTQATGIHHNGVTVGFWSATNTGTDATFGFIRTATFPNFTYIRVNNPPLASTRQSTSYRESTSPKSLSASTMTLPMCRTATPNSLKTGQFTAVDVPGAVCDAATGIGNDGMVRGFFTHGPGRTQGFVKPRSGVSLTSLAVPGRAVTQFLGINDRGIVIGFYVGTDTIPHGVAYNRPAAN
jgi:hypothetical protein